MLDSHAMVTIKTFGEAWPIRQRELQAPLAWLAASVLLHALVLAAFPNAAAPPMPLPEVLRVTIEKSEPPRVAAARAEPAARVVPLAKPPQDKPRMEAAREQSKAPIPRSTPEVASREILSLPQSQVFPAPQVAAAAPEKAIEQPREPTESARPAPPAQNIAAARPSPPRVTDAYVLDSPVRYPRTAEHGRVTLKVLVSRDGRAANASLEKPSGYATLDRHALTAVRRWRFAPARQGEELVEQWLTVNVDY